MNMGLALALLGLTTVAVAALLLPLILRGRGNQARDAYNLAVYRDQLAEIARDVERGILSPAEAEAAKSEIGRRILALTPSAAPVASSTVPLALAAVAIIALPFTAWSLYWTLGSPTLGDQPLASRDAKNVQTAVSQNDPHVDMGDAVRKLVLHLQEKPDDLEGWVLLARSYVDLSRYRDAADAYRHAMDLSKQKPEIVGDWAEATVLAAGGTVTPEAKQAFQTAMADADSAPRSRYYLALAKLQDGDAKAALQDWVDLEAASPPDADWLPLLRRRISDTAKTAGVDPATLKTSAGAARKPPAQTATASPPAGPAPASAPLAASNASPSENNMPSTAQVAAAAQATNGMSTQDREAMINSMVQRLADRLQQNPDDADGWVRLGRAYTVLEKPDKAAEAFGHAVKLKPTDTGLKQQYAEALIEGNSGAAEPPAQATALFRDVLAAEPQNPEALWYIGIAEATAGHAQTAHDLWSRLLAQLPADAPARQEVQERLAALKLDK